VPLIALTQQLRQLGDVHRDPSRLIAREQISRRLVRSDMTFNDALRVCALCTKSMMEASMAEQQVYSEEQVDFGKYTTLNFNFTGSPTVPPKKILELTTLTLAYFPGATGGTVGRADIAGRDSGNNAVWRLQIVYVEPLKTAHLTFPNALQLGEGGHVEIGFVNDGPGTIFISANGSLVDK
jgi:hypothetical protein